MRFSTLLIAGLAVLTAGLALTQLRSHSSLRRVALQKIQKFAEWRKTHGKLYSTPSEADYRLQVFSGQLDFIEESNEQYEEAIAARGEKLSGSMFAINSFGDLSQEEFSARYSGGLPLSDEYILQDVSEDSDSFPVSGISPSDSTLGQSPFVPKIRDQGGCASCWAFATIVEVERTYFMRSGNKYVDLSQQELVDCDTRQSGCNGGRPELAFNYIKEFGIHTISDYPYIAAQTTCQKSKPRSIGFPEFGFTLNRAWTTAYSVKLYQEQIHPAVGLYGSGKFRYLANAEDVFDAKLSGECNKEMDHLVSQSSFINGVALIVNSFGTDWGNAGIKKIKPCSDTNLWGFGSRLAHPWTSITP